MNVSECVEIIMQRGVFLIMKMLRIRSGEKKKRKTKNKTKTSLVSREETKKKKIGICERNLMFQS